MTIKIMADMLFNLGTKFQSSMLNSQIFISPWKWYFSSTWHI